jgi:hypothetical protein
VASGVHDVKFTIDLCCVQWCIVTVIRDGRHRNRGLIPGRGSTFFFSPKPAVFIVATKPPIQSVPRPLFLNVKRLGGGESLHSPTHSAEIENVWRYTTLGIHLFSVLCVLISLYI